MSQISVANYIGSSYSISQNLLLPIRSGLQLELDSDNPFSVTKDGSDKVSEWGDGSGNSNNSLQGTAVDQPLWVASGIGGKPSIRFSGTSDNLVVADSASVSLTGDCSFFAVINSTANANHQNIVSKGNESYRWRVDSDGKLLFLINDGGGLLTFNSIGTITRDTDTIVSTLIDIGSSVNFFINGVASGTPATSKPSIADTTDPLIIGALSNIAEEFNGDIGNIIIYDRLLSTVERQIVERYLSQRRGVALI